MTTLNAVGLVVLGLVAGVFSGLVGIGGGIIIVPALIFLFGFSQHLAQGTTLALLVPPIGLLAALAYYQKGLVNLPAAAIICAGFVVGGFVGGKWAVGLSDQLLRKTFAVVLVLIALKMFFTKD
ncbi:MAG: sulfite exporter TauE/SafE family protein [candidate division Zixibacteria bacterium]|nr:sulfite exporter TauE/SafE family protein [candidate division Zixibacteria bacterium]